MGSVVCVASAPSTVARAATIQRRPSLVSAARLRPSTTTVPDLYGLSEGAAIDKAASVGLTIPGASKEYEFNCVDSQDPAPGTKVLRGSAITVHIARNCPARISVPDLSGSTESDARGELSSMGLALGAVGSAPSNRYVAGEVVGQQPAAGTLVARGGVVSITLSAGSSEPVAPPPSTHRVVTVVVPDVRGMAIEVARQRLGRDGLRAAGNVARQPSSQSAGTIILQSPAAGTVVRRGSSIVLTAASPQSRIQVPDLVGRTVANARADLARVGLARGSLSYTNSDASPGLVLVQTPVAGAWVSPGSVVALELSQTRTVRVPHLRGLGLEAAAAAIVRAGLSMGRILPADLDSIADVVAAQLPRAGKHVPVGTAVQLTFGHAGRASIVLSDSVVGVRDSLVAEMSTTPPGSAAVYRFQFGDGSTTGWTMRHRVTHRYAAPGLYVVSGAARTAGGVVMNARDMPVRVKPVPPIPLAAIIVIGGAAGALLIKTLWPVPVVTATAHLMPPSRVVADVGSRPAWTVALITPGRLTSASVVPAGPAKRITEAS